MSNSQADELKIKVRREVCRNTTITSNDIEEPSNSQLSDSSTKSSPSQTINISQESKQVAEKDCQTADGIFLEKEE